MDRSAEAFTSQIVGFLTNSVKYVAFSLAARQSTQCHKTASAGKQWNELLGSLAGRAAKALTQKYAVRRTESI